MKRPPPICRTEAELGRVGRLMREGEGDSVKKAAGLISCDPSNLSKGELGDASYVKLVIREIEHYARERALREERGLRERGLRFEPTVRRVYHLPRYAQQAIDEAREPERARRRELARAVLGMSGIGVEEEADRPDRLSAAVHGEGFFVDLDHLNVHHRSDPGVRLPGWRHHNEPDDVARLRRIAAFINEEASRRTM